MSQKRKNILIALAVVLAFAIAGHMDAQDQNCSWNGCGDARYAQGE